MAPLEYLLCLESEEVEDYIRAEGSHSPFPGNKLVPEPLLELAYQAPTLSTYQVAVGK